MKTKTTFALLLLVTFCNYSECKGSFRIRWSGSKSLSSSGGWSSLFSSWFSSKAKPALVYKPPAAKPSSYGWNFGGNNPKPVAPPAHPSYYNYRNSYPSSYGSTFGSKRLGDNTYISNNYYYNAGSQGGGSSGFLTNALLFGAGVQAGSKREVQNSYNRRSSWDSEQDRRWRATTKAPYFENKIPGNLYLKLSNQCLF
jgi:hypothetical protein